MNNLTYKTNANTIDFHTSTDSVVGSSNYVVKSFPPRKINNIDGIPIGIFGAIEAAFNPKITDEELRKMFLETNYNLI